MRKAVNTFFWRRFVSGMGWSGLLAFVITAAVFFWLLARGERSWTVVAIGVVLLVFTVLFPVLWWTQHAAMRKKLEALPSRKAEISLDSESITIASEAGSARLSWQGFEEVWKYQDFWLLFLAPNNFVTLTVDGVPQEALDAIEARLPPSCKRM